MRLAARVRISRAVRLSSSSRLFMQAATPKMRSSNSTRVYDLPLVNFAFSSNPTNKNLMQSRLDIPTAPFRRQFRIVYMFVRTQGALTSQILTFHTELPYRYVYKPTRCIKIPVIRLYFTLDALHVSDCISPSSGATL